MKKESIRKIIAAGMLFIIPFTMTSCGKPETLVETKADYNISVPRKDKNSSMDFTINIPFYKIVKGNSGIKDAKKELIITGNELEFDGDNVKDINTASLTLRQHKLSDLVKDDEKYYYINLSKAYSEIKDSDKKLTEDEIKERVKPYMNCYVVSGVLKYSGNITNDVTVKSISVPQYNFKYKFDNFNIRISEKDTKGIVQDDEKQIDFSTAGQNHIDQYIDVMGYCPLSGKNITNIDEISMLSINGTAQMIKNKIDDKYLKKDTEFSDGFGYLIKDVISNIENDNYNSTTGTAVSLVCQIKANQKTYWKPIIQTYCVDGIYLITSII